MIKKWIITPEDEQYRKQWTGSEKYKTFHPACLRFWDWCLETQSPISDREMNQLENLVTGRTLK